MTRLPIDGRLPPPAAGCDGDGTAADDDGESLARSRLLGRVGLDEFLALAEELASLLAGVHRQGVIVNILRPDTIRVRGRSPRLAIADYSLATTFAEEHGRLDVIGDALDAAAYASPEQTGRMNRSVDYRTDLYSLGATLYALATGEPPFPESTAMGTMHAHLAREPRSPREAAPWLPPCVADVILRLLAKEPDKRYQSAAGVADDLARLRRAARDGRPLEDVRLRQRDMALILRPSQRLRGRAAQIASIEAAFERVAHGETARLFVAGPSGVGKTALIHELRRAVTLRRGVFASGKFEQFQMHRPFVGLAQSMRQLAHVLLAEPESELAGLRQRLTAALGPHAGALVEVAPELRPLLGDVGPPPDVTPVQAQARLRTLFVRFMREIATPGRPRVLVLDDLQWADQPSLHLLAALLAEASLPGLLVIGAYRDDEVDHSHPLALLLRQPASAGGPPTILTLEGLGPADLEAFLAETLHVSVAEARPLADIALATGGGNPLFTNALLDAWHREGSLWPDPEAGRWRWDECRIATSRDRTSVTEWLRADLARLPAAIADTLTTAACLGGEFSLGLLALATDTPTPDLVERLLPALEDGLLVTSTAVAFSRAEPDASLRFRHDGMQQAAYHLEDEPARQRRHLDIARRLHAASVGLDARFARQAAEQYVEARELITSPTERGIVRRLFLDAGRQARRAGAFAVAERYLRSGVGLLPAEHWSAAPDEAWEFTAELHLVCYGQAKHGEADTIYRTLSARAAAPIRLVDPACVQVMSLSSRALHAEALQLGCRLLGDLGVRVPQDDPLPGLEQELEALERHVAAGRLDALPRKPAGVDADRDGAAKLMNRMIPAAFFLDPMLASWMATHCGRQWIEEGYRPAHAYPMTCVLLATVGRRGDYATGYRAATQSLAAAAAAGEHGVEMARARHVFGLFGCHWFEPLEQALGHARQAFDGLMLAGEPEFACYTFFTSQAALLDTCDCLDELGQETAAALDFAVKMDNRHAEPAYLAYRQFVRALEGRTLAPGSFSDSEFDEARHMASEAGNPMARCYFHLHRALAACIYADDEALIRHAEAAADLAVFITGFYPTVLVTLVHALSLTVRLRRGMDRSTLEPRLAAARSWLTARAADAPTNFAHLVDFLEASTHDALGRPHEAFVAFERALRRAGVARRPWHLALITEHAGRCFLRHDLDHAGRLLLAEAHARYRSFGAKGKVAALEQELPFLRELPSNPDPAAAGQRVDEQAIVSAAKALASERSVPRLVARVVEVVGQLTGATDVRILALDIEGRWMLKGGSRGGLPLDRMPTEEAVARGQVADSVLRLGLATLDPIVSEDAVLDGRFRDDPYFGGMTLCSLLAIPVLVQGRPKAFVILENRLFRDAFTPRHVATIAAICGQLAVCIENVRMYESLERKVAERTREAEEARARERRSEGRQRRELESKLKTSLSAAAVAHEINLPLSNILLGARLALEALDAPAADVERLRPTLAGLVDEAKRVVTTIDKMRMLLRNVQTELVPVDLVTVMQTAALFAQPVLDDHGIDFQLGPLAGRCLVRGDAVQLQAAIVNLLRNAAEAAATRPAGARRVVADVRLEGEGDAGAAGDTAAVIVVGDNGPGFPKESFGDPLETTKPYGTGLGLYVVQSTVENHGGRIVVGRSPLGGAEVRIVLPVMKSQADA